jgi:hypothetical protein
MAARRPKVNRRMEVILFRDPQEINLFRGKRMQDSTKEAALF